MKADKQFVTQITKEDMKEIAAAANIHAGEGISVSKDGDGIVVSVDKQVLRMWVQTIINGGQIGG